MSKSIYPVDVPEWDGSSPVSLQDLEKLLPILKKKYGANAIVYFDAGANNVSVQILPSKMVK